MSPVEALVRFIATAPAAYLLGSIPTGVLVGKLFGNRDPRATGSGKTGATNVLRTLGPGPAAVVVLVDVAKGAAAVLRARNVFLGGQPELRGYAEALAGFAE
ncbi:MAG TPA: glycerol-3-phosphate acyltransferase [Ktedonobacterales bacterium]|nr:glycerol-3-phosphate acyltransferase [Ktedonobacterales bacterium]